MTPAALPFAARFDWLEGLLPALFMLFWIGSQIVGALQKAQRRPPAGRPLVPARDAAEEARRRTEIDRQLEEFIARTRPQAAPRAPRQPLSVDRKLAGPTARRAAGEPPPRPSGGGPPRPAVVRGLRPGADVARHVHDAFAHGFEHLASSLPATVATGAEPRPPAAAVPAAELTAALRNPVTLRQLILLREVLDRPVDRW